MVKFGGGNEEMIQDASGFLWKGHAGLESGSHSQSRFVTAIVYWKKSCSFHLQSSLQISETLSRKFDF